MRTLNRREFLQAGTAVGLSAAAPSRPNIVLFYADDLDADEIGCLAGSPNYSHHTGAAKRGYAAGRGYADPRMLTPHIDGLAKGGAELTRFYITSPVCTPARCTILTGHYASRSPLFLKRYPPGGLSAIGWNTPIVPEETNLAKELQRLGYATGMVGKWHNFPGPEKLPEVDQSFGEGDDAREPSVARRLREKHERARKALTERYGWDFADRINFGNTEQTRPAAIRGQNLEWHTEGALEFLARYGDRPFFLYYALPVPHGQYNDMKRLNPLATAAGMLDKPASGQPSRESVYQRLDAAGIDRRNAMATWMDDAVGAVLAAIERRGAMRNTIVLFISDNPSRGKNSCYEGARVPALVRWPARVKAGSRVDSLCANADIPATLIEAAGGKPPAEMTRDGLSFLPQLLGQGEPAGWRDQLLLEVHNSRAVVTRRWKYIANRLTGKEAEAMQAEASSGTKRTIGWNGLDHHNYEAERDFPAYYAADQLYDVIADVYEQKNLAGTEPGVLKEMKQRMTKALEPLPHTFGEFKR